MRAGENGIRFPESADVVRFVAGWMRTSRPFAIRSEIADRSTNPSLRDNRGTKEINCATPIRSSASPCHVDDVNAGINMTFRETSTSVRFMGLNVVPFTTPLREGTGVGDEIQPSRRGHLSVKFPGDPRRFAGRWRRRHGTDTPSVATLLSINKSTADVRQRPFYFSAG